MQNVIKIILVTIFFVCLLDMPYAYYQAVRLIALISFVALAYKASRNSRQIEVIIYYILVLLFQPFFKIALGRQIWNIVDVVVGFLLIVSIVIELQQNKINEVSKGAQQ